MGVAAVSGQLIGGALIQADVAGLGWRSCFLINVPIGLIAVVLARRRRAGVALEQGSRLDSAGRSLLTVGVDRGGAAARRGTPARLATVDLGVARDRAADPGRLRRPPAAPGARGGEPLIAPALFRNRAFRAGPAHPARVLVGPGVVLPRARAVPAAGPGPERAGLGPGVHDPGDILRGRVGAGAGADRPPRPAADGDRRARAGRRATGCCSRPWPTSASAARWSPRARAAADRRRDGAADRPADDHDPVQRRPPSTPARPLGR